MHTSENGLNIVDSDGDGEERSEPIHEQSHLFADGESFGVGVASEEKGDGEEKAECEGGYDRHHHRELGRPWRPSS